MPPSWGENRGGKVLKKSYEPKVKAPESSYLITGQDPPGAGKEMPGERKSREKKNT